MSAPDKLFDDINRVYNGPAKFAESTFDYLNRSASPESQKVRKLLEEWFSRYPDEEKKILRTAYDLMIGVFIQHFLNFIFAICF